jgi:hypothetical protein
MVTFSVWTADSKASAARDGSATVRDTATVWETTPIKWREAAMADKAAARSRRLMVKGRRRWGLVDEYIVRPSHGTSFENFSMSAALP